MQRLQSQSHLPLQGDKGRLTFVSACAHVLNTQMLNAVLQTHAHPHCFLIHARQKRVRMLFLVDLVCASQITAAMHTIHLQAHAQAYVLINKYVHGHKMVRPSLMLTEI